MTTDTQATWQMPDAKYQRRSGGTLARLPLPNVRSKGMRRGTKEERETDEGQNKNIDGELTSSSRKRTLGSRGLLFLAGEPWNGERSPSFPVFPASVPSFPVRPQVQTLGRASVQTNQQVKNK